MKIFNSISEFHSVKKTIVTLGTFDGVHIGHNAVLDKLIENTADGIFENLVLTFFPHPRTVLREKQALKLLNTIDEKIDLLNKKGIDNLIIHPFDQAFSQLTAEKFVKEILVDQLNVQKIIIGYDHRFGQNRTADINDLIAFGLQYGFEVEQISVQEMNAIAVSSTKIRNSLEDGEINLANKLLGYQYTLSGKVVKGRQIGRTLSFPTANLALTADYKLVPKNGVYIVKINIDNRLLFGLMNIGIRPTFETTNHTLEVHILDFNEDIYDQIIHISFLERIRAEQKFENVNLLKAQLEEDKALAIDYLAKI